MSDYARSLNPRLGVYCASIGEKCAPHSSGEVNFGSWSGSVPRAHLAKRIPVVSETAPRWDIYCASESSN